MEARTQDTERLPVGRLDEPAAGGRSLVLWLTNASHALNHFQAQMVAVLYPVILTQLGFGYAQLGVIAAVRNLFGTGTQVIYGFLVHFARHTVLLGVGNLIVGLGTLLTGMSGSYLQFLGARTLSAAGSSAQHPVGSSLLTRTFPSRRGTILALNNSIAGVGSLLAPAVAGLLLPLLGWRSVFMVVAGASLAVGLAYLLAGERAGATEQAAGPGVKRLTRGWASYRRVFRNRNIVVISLVMMAGAAGSGEGVNVTYLGPHLVRDLALSVAVAGLLLSAMQLGGIAGPLGFGWLSDRFSRTAVLQASLLGSALATWWLAFQTGALAVLLLNILVYGALTMSRNPLTQALVADSLSDADRDAAFSVYYFLGFISGPLWALITGLIMQAAGFRVAFSVLGFSYLVGMILVSFARDPGIKHAAAAAAAIGADPGESA